MFFRFDRTAVDTAKSFLPFSAVIGILGLLFSQNPLLTVAGVAILPLLVLLLWRSGEPPVLLFSALFQWLQIFTPVADADIRGVVIGTEIGVPEIATAAWLGLGALLILAIGIRIGFGGGRLLKPNESFEGWIEQVSVGRIFLCYLAAKVVGIGLGYFGREYPSIVQIAIALNSFGTIFIFLLVWGAVREQRFRTPATAIVIFEVLQGFGGYFSEFKIVLLICILIYYSRPFTRVRLFNPVAVSLFLAVLALGLLWQTVKGEYRIFLNQGTNMQVVLVSPEDRAEFLLGELAALSMDDLVEASESLIRRLGYLEYFGRSIQMVPTFIPYQDGRLWGEAFTHVLTPRIFNPDKPAVSDSDRTNEFTGIRVAGPDSGTSVGIGYLGESYIDFGPAGMLVPVFLLGVFWGWGYRWFCRISPAPLLGLAVATSFALRASLVETSNIKLMGGAIMSLLILSPVLYYGGAIIWRLLQMPGWSASKRAPAGHLRG